MKRALEDIRNEIINYSNGRDRLVYTGHRNLYETKISMSDEFKKTQLYVDIFDTTDFLPKEANLYVRLKSIIDRITRVPICPICNKNHVGLKDNYIYGIFNKICSTKCRSFNARSKKKPMTDETKEIHGKYFKKTAQFYREQQNKVYQIYLKDI